MPQDNRQLGIITESDPVLCTSAQNYLTKLTYVSYSFARIAQKSYLSRTPYGSSLGDNPRSSLQNSIAVLLHPFLPRMSMYFIRHSQNVLFKGSQFGLRSISILGMKEASYSLPAPRCTNWKSKENEFSKAYKHLSKKSAASANLP